MPPSIQCAIHFRSSFANVQLSTCSAGGRGVLGLARRVYRADVQASGASPLAALAKGPQSKRALSCSVQSIVGSVLDPFADKVLVGSLSLSMLWSGLLPWPLVTLIVGRDLLLVGGTFYYRLKTKDATSGFFDTSDSGAFEVKPSMLSKVNTALQLSLFGFALTNAAWQIPGDQALNLLWYAA